jgi:hypothetical protein
MIVLQVSLLSFVSGRERARCYDSSSICGHHYFGEESSMKARHIAAAAAVLAALFALAPAAEAQDKAMSEAGVMASDLIGANIITKKNMKALAKLRTSFSLSKMGKQHTSSSMWARKTWRWNYHS